MKPPAVWPDPAAARKIGHRWLAAAVPLMLVGVTLRAAGFISIGVPIVWAAWICACGASYWTGRQDCAKLVQSMAPKPPETPDSPDTEGTV